MIRRNPSPGIALLLMVSLCVVPPLDGFSFGFFAHRKINRMAVFTLPPQMVGFFKKHVEYLSERSIDPDRRAHAVVGEAPRHFIDLELYGEDPSEIFPMRWHQAVETYSEDFLNTHGVLPWHITLMLENLTRAFEDKEVDRILYHAANIGHYIADACTPLHTTQFYNGRIPSERGIHALWESRLPELYANNFNYLVGRADYIPAPHTRAWELITISHQQVDTIYAIFNGMMQKFDPDKVFTHETRGQNLVKVYSSEFSLALHQGLDYMVERQMQLAVKSVGDFWYTAWVNAGQPDLYRLEKKAISRAHRKKLKEDEDFWNQVPQTEGRP